jgi:GNAT superfamily N-acetyltransferase
LQTQLFIIRKMKNYYISTNKKLIDAKKVFQLLRNCFWSQDIPIEYVERLIQHSFCFAAYKNEDNELVGFARVITDYTTFAYICDVVVDPPHRNLGIGKSLAAAILQHQELKGLKTWSLRTSTEARKIYADLGFKPAEEPETILEIQDLNIYKKENFINLFATEQ